MWYLIVSIPDLYTLTYLHLSNSINIVSIKVYDKRDDFYFEIVNFPFLDGDVSRSTSYGAYISQLIRFARAGSGVVLDCIVPCSLPPVLLLLYFEMNRLKKILH